MDNAIVVEVLKLAVTLMTGFGICELTHRQVAKRETIAAERRAGEIAAEATKAQRVQLEQAGERVITHLFEIMYWLSLDNYCTVADEAAANADYQRIRQNIAELQALVTLHFPEQAKTATDLSWTVHHHRTWLPSAIKDGLQKTPSFVEIINAGQVLARQLEHNIVEHLQSSK